MSERNQHEFNLTLLEQAIPHLRLINKLEQKPYFIMLIDELTQLHNTLSGKEIIKPKVVRHIEYSQDMIEKINMYLLKKSFEDDFPPDDEPPSGGGSGKKKNDNKPSIKKNR